MAHLIQENRISTQGPQVHTMPGAALLSGVQKRRSVCGQTLAEGLLDTATPISLPTYIVELNNTSNEDQGQAGQVM